MNLIFATSLLLCLGLATGTPVQKLVGANHCVWGPSYWCQHVDAAKECQAMPYCVGVWKNNKPAIQGLQGSYCTFCQTFINDLKSALASGTTKAELTALAQTACALVPQPELAALCRATVTLYMPEIISMVEKDLNASQICSALGLCTGFAPRVQLRKAAFLTTVQGKRASTAAKVSHHRSRGQLFASLKKGSAGCDECKAMVAEVQTVLKNNATTSEVEQILKTYLCNELGELKALCNSYVDQYVPEIIQLLAQNLDPNSVCQLLGFCSKSNDLKNLARTRQAFLKVVFGRQLVKALPAASPAECEVCELVVTEARSMLRSNRTQTEIENFLRDRLCTHLGQFKAQCQAYVTQFSPMIFQLLVSELNPTAVCQALGACGKAVRTTQATRIAELSSRRATTSEVCVLCEYVIGYVENKLKSNRSQAAIEHTLEEVCSVLPSTVRTECDALVRQYSQMIIRLLLAEIAPAQICTALGLCSGQKSAVAVTSPQCVLCEFVIGTLDRQLATNRSEAAIQAALLKVCSILPSTIRTECDSFVSEYGPAVIKLLIAQISPSKVCTTLGLCSGRRVVSQSAPSPLYFMPGPVLSQPARRPAPASLTQLRQRFRASGELCQVCQLAMQYMDSLLKENATVQETERLLQKVCAFLPASDSQMCDTLVRVYWPQIVQLIVAELNPQQICAGLRLCTASKTKFVYGRVHLEHN